MQAVKIEVQNLGQRMAAQLTLLELRMTIKLGGFALVPNLLVGNQVRQALACQLSGSWSPSTKLRAGFQDRIPKRELGNAANVPYSPALTSNSIFQRPLSFWETACSSSVPTSVTAAHRWTGTTSPGLRPSSGRVISISSSSDSSSSVQ